MKQPILIIGHARHGKDTVAEMLAERINAQFTSSSEFVGRECIWDVWGKERYCTFEEMFEDRVNNRELWKNLIAAYNTPNECRTAETMIKQGNDFYVGMRRKKEYEACINKNIFGLTVFVDASKRLPLEDASSMELDINVLNQNNNKIYKLRNNGDLNYLNEQVDILAKYLVNFYGYSFNSSIENTKFKKELSWLDAPEGYTKVLDHGFIKVQEVMGSDKTIAESARMSYGRGTKKVNNDEGLINYLMNNHHTSPMEMGEIKFHIRMPIFVARQWIRHRTANLNEYSGRYSEMVRLFYLPELSEIRDQHKVNKQGSGNSLSVDKASEAQYNILTASDYAFDEYENLLALGVSRETARIILPLNTYTEVVWKLDVSNLIKFLWLRDDDHAQWEIRQYAIEVAKAVKENFPLTYSAYEKIRKSITLSLDQINALVTGNTSLLSKSETATVDHLLETNAFNVSDYPDYGTLEDIGPKVGDVVNFHYKGSYKRAKYNQTITDISNGVYKAVKTDGRSIEGVLWNTDNSGSYWEMIKRA